MTFISRHYLRLYELTKWEWLYSRYNPINRIRGIIDYPFQLVYMLSHYSKFFKKWALEKDIATLSWQTNTYCRNCGTCHPCSHLLRYNNELRLLLIDELLESL